MSAGKGAQLIDHVPHELCVPRWSGDFVTPLREVVRDVEVAFSLRENPHPSNFITEAALRACELVPARSSQVVFAANLSTTVLPPSGEVALEIAPVPSGCVSVIESVIAISCLFSLFVFFLFDNSNVFAFTVVLPTFKGVSAHCHQLVAKGQVSKAPRRSEDNTFRLSTDALRTSTPQDSAQVAK